MTERPVLDKAEHVALIKAALEATLSARAEHDIREEERQDQEERLASFKLIPIGDLWQTSPEKLRLEGLAKDPVRYALRKQVRELGKELHQVLGNTDAMLDVAEEVAAKDFQYRMTIIDKAWDGIGDWYA
jgi:hypothetical protein